MKKNIGFWTWDVIFKNIISILITIFMLFGCKGNIEPIIEHFNKEYDSTCPKGQSPPNNLVGDEPIPSVQVDSEPNWSPDGRWIAYIHYQDTIPLFNYELWLIDPKTLEKKIITYGAIGLEWFPSSQKLVVNLVDNQLYIIDLDGKVEKKLTENGYNHFPSLSPDGKWLAWDVDYWDICIMNLENGQKRFIQKDSSATGKSAWRYPSWSPDGSKIVHIRYGHYLPYGYEAIYIMNSDGTEGRRLTYYEREHLFPCWASVGNKIAFSSRGCEWLRDIFIYDLNSNEIKRITFEGGDEPSFSPDGAHIVYSKNDWVNYDPEKGSRTGFLHIINIHTLEDRQITFDYNLSD